MLRQEGVESLLFTSDNPTLSEDWGNIDYELMTANFRWDSEENLKKIKELRPNSPILVSEFWPGWFDHWFEQYHNTLSEEKFRVILGNIFKKIDQFSKKKKKHFRPKKQAGAELKNKKKLFLAKNCEKN